ncbi:amino acid permease-domain-containing protein [Lanmaoa asiatica]|nr:amino acid permease-domain-containing protein [Lanmaoa asiatica]
MQPSGWSQGLTTVLRAPLRSRNLDVPETVSFHIVTVYVGSSLNNDTPEVALEVVFVLYQRHAFESSVYSMDTPSTLVETGVTGFFPSGAEIPTVQSVIVNTSDEVQFDIVLRRQRTRTSGKPKFKAVPSRFLNLSDDFEFAGWGSIFRIALSRDDLSHGHNALLELRNQRVLGQFAASALAANDILGGVFYTIPSVFAIAGVYSPLSMFVATLTLFLWRPIMVELGSALPISGAPYTYLYVLPLISLTKISTRKHGFHCDRLNGSTKAVALVGAALLLLDFAATAVVSAATATSYLAGEVALPFPLYIGALLVFVLFTAVGLMGLRESARIASGVLALHLFTMLGLGIACIVAWASAGTLQLRENWVVGQAGLSSPASILKQTFNGVCIGMLGLTGFECAPAYAAKMRPGTFPKVLHNLHISTMILNPMMMLFVLALLPLNVQTQENVLSLLAQQVRLIFVLCYGCRRRIVQVAGRWLRIWVVADAVIVLCAGVLTGIASACELLAELAHDYVLPRAFLAALPYTGALYVAILSFVGFSGVIYASTAANLIVVSKMFSLVWLAVMALFPVSLVLLRFSRPRLPRLSRCSLSSVIGAVLVAVTVFVGNIAIDPSIAGWFALYFLVLLLFFSITDNKVAILRWAYWVYDQVPLLHQVRPTRDWGGALIRAMKKLKRQEVCLLVRTDEINQLFNMILYVQHNEETSCLKMVHFHEGIVPSEMVANAKILDEAFPEITIDLAR